MKNQICLNIKKKSKRPNHIRGIFESNNAVEFYFQGECCLIQKFLPGYRIPALALLNENSQKNLKREIIG